MNDIVSRRKTFSLLGLAAAALALAVPTTVLTVVPEEAEAQTTGMSAVKHGVELARNDVRYGAQLAHSDARCDVAWRQHD